MKKTAAGLILFTKDPHKGLVAVLSRRGEFDYEEFKPEVYENLYEASAGGAIESGEHLIQGLLREVEEELGGAAAKLIKHYTTQFHTVAYQEHNYADYQIAMYTYAVYIPHLPLTILKPHRSSVGLRLITAREVPDIQPIIRNNGRKGPAKDDPIMRMFPDQLEGLKKGFQLFTKSKTAQ
jgi:NUDIX domain